jgi:hypothetical protein
VKFETGRFWEREMRTDTMRFAIQPAILALTLALPLSGASAQSRDVDLELILAVDS